MEKVLLVTVTSIVLFAGGCMATLDGIAQDGIAALQYVDDSITSEK